MPELKTTPSFSDRIIQRLPSILIVLFVLQPFMDILSYWMDRLGMANTLTLALRFLVLAGFGLLGFCLSKRKRVYLIFAGLCLSLLIGHVIACSIKGYLNPVSDITNLVRIIQMPLFAFCFITALKANRRCARAIEQGCVINFWIIGASIALALITGTASPTYEESGYGLIGWFATTNAQSAVLSILTPIVVTLAYRRRNFPLFVLTSLAAFAQLYFLATRLAFLAIAVTCFGLLITAIVTKNVSKKYFVVLFVLLAVCVGTIKISPMYKNQTRYNQAMAGKQGDAEVMMARQAAREGSKPWNELSLVEKLPRLRIIYRYYSKQLCLRFNVYRVMKAYDYTSSIMKITATRHQKIVFCQMLLDEHPTVSRFFGMELSRMTFHDNIYDVENDFHGVYFLSGWYGLILMLGFILYFVWLIVRALMKDFKHVFTIEAGAFGMAFCLALLYSYETAGVLRRPNSSFYLSMLLAMVYYLTKLRYYPALPEETSEGTR